MGVTEVTQREDNQCVNTKYSFFNIAALYGFTFERDT